jgi:hypothetical protein
MFSNAGSFFTQKVEFEWRWISNGYVSVIPQLRYNLVLITFKSISCIDVLKGQDRTVNFITFKLPSAVWYYKGFLG